MNVFQKIAADATESKEKQSALEAAEAEGAAEAKMMDKDQAMERTRAIEAEWKTEARRMAGADAKGRAKAAGAVEKNKRCPKLKRLRVPKLPKLRITKGEKLGNGHLSHDRDGHEVAAIEDVNAGLRKESGLDFTIDEDEPRSLNFLTFEDMERSYNAMMFLHCLGLEWNVWYTCTWASVELTTDEQVAEAIQKHVESLRHWVTKRKKGDKGEKRKFYYIWSVERGERHGLHFHMLLHLPADVDLDLFERQVHQNILTLTGMRPRVPAGESWKTPKRGHKKPPECGIDAPVDETRTVYIVRNSGVNQQWERWRYILKGLDPDECMRLPEHGLRQRTTIHEYLGLNRESHEGRYGGRRLGVSQWLKTKQIRIFDRKYGLPPNPLLTVAKPSDLYGDQFLKWAEARRKPEPEPGPEPRERLLKSLDGWM